MISPFLHFMLSAILAAHPASGDRRGEIDLAVSSEGIGIAPSGDLWIGSGQEYARTNGPGHLYVSRDSGKSWAESDYLKEESGNPAETPLGIISAIAFFDRTHGLAIGRSLGRRHRLLLTEDGGDTWLPWSVSSLDWASLLQVFPDGCGWVCGPSILLRSGDFGRTWASIQTSPGSANYGESMNFVSSARGIVATDAGRHALLLTEDSGKSWREIPLPQKPLFSLADGVDADDVYLTDIGPVALVGDTIVARERFLIAPLADTRNQVVACKVGSPAEWRTLQVNGSTIRTFSRYREGLAVITEDHRVATLSNSLTPVQVFQVPIGNEPRPIEFSNVSSAWGHLALFDQRAHVGMLEAEGLRIEHLFTSETNPQYPIRESIPVGGESLLGVSRLFLYRSGGTNRAWERLGELPRRDLSLVPTKAGNGLLLGRASPFYVWRGSDARLEKQADSDHFYKTGLLRRGDLWLLYGMFATDEHHADISTNSTDTVLAGDAYEGVVFASGDGGDMWSVLDRWPGGRVEAVDLDERGWLAIYRAGGGVRRGPLDLQDPKHPKAELHTLVEPGPPWEERPSWPYVQYGIEIKFQDAVHGSVTGGMYFSGQRAFETDDGGKTWFRTDASPEGR